MMNSDSLMDKGKDLASEAARKEVEDQIKQRMNKEEPIDRDNEDEVEVVEVVEELVEDGNGGKRMKKRNVKKMVRKPRRRSFDLGGSIHLKPLSYDALKDDHLKSFFYSTRIRRHLEKQHLITKDGYIIENPQEYYAHKKIVREHMKSSSPGRRVKKTKKTSKKKATGQGKGQAEPVAKENFDEFLNSVKNQYGVDGEQKNKNQSHVSEKNDVEPKPQPTQGNIPPQQPKQNTEPATQTQNTTAPKPAQTNPAPQNNTLQNPAPQTTTTTAQNPPPQTTTTTQNPAPQTTKPVENNVGQASETLPKQNTVHPQVVAQVKATPQPEVKKEEEKPQEDEF